MCLAQKRSNAACSKYDSTEKGYGDIKEVQAKLDKVSTNISACSNKIKKIESVFQSLETEFQTYIQDQSVKDIPFLRLSVCTNKPLMDVDNITDLSNILLKCQDNIDSLFVQRFELNSISRH